MDSVGQSSSSVGIGNYKGIMLSNRPCAEPAPPVSQEGRFLCGVVPEPAGISVSILAKERVKSKKENKDGVLCKHKKWLAQLQKAKEQLQVDSMLEYQRKEEILMKLSEQAKRQRQLTLGRAEDKLSSKICDQNEISDAHEPFEDDWTRSEAKEIKKSVEVSTHLDKIPKRPAWALTAKSKNDADGTYEDFEDPEDLIDFAQSLDYNRYIEDVEIQGLMAQMKVRICELEREIQSDERGRSLLEVERKDVAVLRDKLIEMGNAVTSLNLEENKAPSERSALAMKVAQSLLEDKKNIDLQAIHSTRSVAAIINSNPSLAGVASEAQPKVFNEPLIVLHEPQGRLVKIRGDKIDASNLPYLHRNPAV